MRLHAFTLSQGVSSVVVTDMEMSVMVNSSGQTRFQKQTLAIPLLTLTLVHAGSQNAMGAVAIPITAGGYNTVSHFTLKSPQWT